MRKLGRPALRGPSLRHPRWLVLASATVLLACLTGGSWWLINREPDRENTVGVADQPYGEENTTHIPGSQTDTGRATPRAPDTPPSATEGDPWRQAMADARAAGLPEIPEPAQDVLLHFVSTAAAMKTEPRVDGVPASAPDYSQIADGPALGELQGQFDEFQNSGWVQTGAPVIAAVLGYEDLETEQGFLRRLSICVDSSTVELKDQEGLILLAAAEPGSRKSLNYYDLQEQDGTWKVVSHSFPDDPAC